MKKHLLPRILCLLLALLMLALPLISCGNQETPPDDSSGGGTGTTEEPETPTHTHSLVTVDEISPTCQTEGVMAHYHCTGCDKNFLDAGASREVGTYELTLRRVSHDYNDGFCRYCDAADPNDRTLSDARRLTSVSVTKNGLLSWSKLKVASKYKLTITLEDGDHNFEITKEKAAFSLSDLPENVRLAYGRNAMTITVYEREEIEIDGEKGYQDVPLWGGKYALVSLREGYEVVPLRYEDDIISIEGFYGEERTEGNRSYLLSEVTIPDNSKGVYPTLRKDLKVKKAGYTAVVYKSADGRENGTGQITVFSTPLSRIPQYYYVRVFDENSQPVKDYDLALRGVSYLNVEMAVETSEKDGDGDRLYHFEYKINSLSNIKFLQGDYMDLSPLFATLPEGYILRDNKWNLYEPGKDYLLPSDAYGVQEFFAAPAETLRAEAAELSLYTDMFDLTRTRWQKNGTSSGSYLFGFSLRLKKSVTNEDLRIPAKILGNRVILTASSFSFLSIRRVILEPGFTELPDRLFYNTNGLVYVAIPATVTSVGDWMFPKAQASYLKIYCEGRINSDSHWNQVEGSFDLFKTYYNQTGVCSATDAGDYTFRLENDALTVTGAKSQTPGAVPEKVKVGFREYPVIGFAKGSLASVTAFEIPSFITEMNLEAFGTDLTTLTVAENHPTYAVFGGLLYNKEQTEILLMPRGITELTFPDTLTEIKSFAFRGNTEITSVTLPASCTVVGSYAFENCTSLRSVTFNSALTEIVLHAFSGCTALTEVDFPASLETIGESAFYGCTALQSVTFAEGLSTIGRNAFAGCTSLGEELIFPATLQSIGGYAFSSCKALRRVVFNNDTRLDGYVFNNATHLVEAIYPGNNKTFAPYLLGVYASKDEPTHIKHADGFIFFEGNDEYYLCGYEGEETALTLPSDYKGHAYKITPYAFEDRNDLTSVVISGATDIGVCAFAGLTNLQSATIGSSVTMIDDSAFAGCSALTTVTGGENLETVAFGAFRSTPFYYKTENRIDGCLYLGTALIASSTSGTLTVRDGTRMISDYAFEKCKNLTEIILPEGLVSIGTRAFSECETLTKVHLPSSLLSIGDNAFEGCYKLADLSIPKGLKMLGSHAFGGCHLLFEITLPKGLVTVGEKIFDSDHLAYAVNFRRHVIYVEAAEKGENWDKDFGLCCTVIYNCKENNLTPDGSYFVYADGLRYRIKDGKASLAVQLFREWAGGNTVTIPDTITIDGTVYPVTAVDDFAFYNVKLRDQTLVIGKNVETIGESAFRNCGIPELDFNGTEKLTYIGPYAFVYLRDGGSSLVLPDCLEEIGNWAFGDCQYTNVTFGTGIRKIGHHAFSTTKDNSTTQTKFFHFQVTEGWTRNGTAISADTMGNYNSSLLRDYLRYEAYYPLIREEAA